MHVVADAGAVGRVVVVAEDDRGLPLLETVQHDRDQVHHGRVRELGPAGAGDVEVAQGDGAHAVGALGIGQHPLPHVLGRAVGVDRLRGEVLGDQVHVRHAVDGGGGREDHVPHPGARTGREHVGQARDVVVPVHLRVLDGLPDLLVGGEVDHRVRAGGPQVEGELLARIGQGDVELDELGPLRPAAQPGREVVDHDHLLPLLQEESHHVRPDVSGTTDHESRHGPKPTGHDGADRNGAMPPCRSGPPHGQAQLQELATGRPSA